MTGLAVFGFGPVAAEIAMLSGPMRPVGDVQGVIGTPTRGSSPPAVLVPAADAAPPPARPARPAPPEAPRDDRGLDPRAAFGVPTPPEHLAGYVWPLPKGRLTLGFRHTPWGSRLVDGQRFHDGIDLATFCGDRIVAAHDGVVLAAGRRYDDHVGWIGDLRPYYRRLDEKGLWHTLPIVIVTDDGNGYRSIYAHFSRVVVKKGDQVKAGQLIGYEGRTGRASGCHLHFGLFSPLEARRFETHPDTVKRMKMPRWEIARVDPLLVLPPRPSPTPKPTPTPGTPLTPSPSPAP